MDEKVKVAIRVRPLNKREHDLKTVNVVKVTGPQVVLEKSPKNKSHNFSFDFCFDSSDAENDNFASQELVFNSIGRKILEDAFKGYNACIFAYGQTGSGKSYTMMGSKVERGIIPRLCSVLFQMIDSGNSENKANVEVSYMEIYNEKVFDLLDMNNNVKTGLKVREHKLFGPYVEGLTVEPVESAEEIENLMEEGNKSRTVASTNMNSESSRSHAVFTITLTFNIKDEESGVTGTKVSKISLVDLAGSERANKTGAQGDRLKEGSNINKSLTTLGLVISKLADAGSKKSKDSFVPYRDSVLTWLLKENLGGNSRTAMIATVSPADDNFEETLSTLRYADRAKRITNFAVVNEDQNAKIIRELRAEVEMLRKMLSNHKSDGDSEDLLEKIAENEGFMRQFQETWEEKLARSGQIGVDRRQALKSLGVHLDSSNKPQHNKDCYISRLSSDPSLNELLVYYLQEKETKVGTKDSDIKLVGLGIKNMHCTLILEKDILFISPVPGAASAVNGRQVMDKTRIYHGDRLLLGSNNFFRVYCPIREEDREMEPEPFDWSQAQAEALRCGDSHNDNVLDSIFTNTGDTVMDWLGTDQRNKMFSKSMDRLKSNWIKAAASVRDANVVASELSRPVKYTITLQIPPEKLSPNNKTGVHCEEPVILVKSASNGSQIWTMDKLDCRLKDMIELYDQITTDNVPFEEIGKSLPDPFFDTFENHVLIGVANIYLQPLFHDLTYKYSCPVIAPDGQVSGKLVLELAKVEGTLGDWDDKRSNSDILSESNYSNTMEGLENVKFKFTIGCASGLPQSLAHFVFCQFSFDEDYPVVVPSMTKTKNYEVIEFNFTKEYDLKVTDSLKEKCQRDAISVQVYGQKAKGFWSKQDAIRDKKRAQTVAERYSIAHPDLCWVCFNLNLKCEHRATRWSELVRKLELWVEVQEMNEYGQYTAVEISPREDVETGGVVQMKHGHQRRIVVRVKPVDNSGKLALNLHSIVGVSVGSVVGRSKFQKPLDSFQDEGLSRVREEWASRVMVVKDRLDTAIHKLADMDKDAESIEKSLLEKKNCVIDELNKVTVATDCNKPQASSAGREMETQVPLIYLDTEEMESNENLTVLNDFLPVVGESCFLPKEQTDDFLMLPIVQILENEVGVVASWDSSAHENSKLNRVTPEHEKLYLIVKVVVRLTDPSPIDLVLRKRLCINIFKRTSLKNFFKKNINAYLGQSCSHRSGVMYELVSRVPDIYPESEWFAQIEANMDEEGDSSKATFFEAYTRAVASIENSLAAEKLKQTELLTEMLARQEESKQLPGMMQKSLSVMNIREPGIKFGQFSKFGGSNRNLSSSQLSLDFALRRSDMDSRKIDLKRRSLPTQRSSIKSPTKSTLSGSAIAEEE